MKVNYQTSLTPIFAALENACAGIYLLFNYGGPSTARAGIPQLSPAFAWNLILIRESVPLSLKYS
jgi:hypothetical protein